MNSSRLLGGATLFLLGLAGLCAIPGCSPASDPSAPGTKLQWRKSTPLPEPRAGHAAGLLDGKFVIAGGTWWEGEKGNWTQKIFSASTHAFDPDTEKWERLPDAPFPFGYAAYTVVENRLYVLGGFDGRQESRKILRLSRKGDGYLWEVFGELPETRLFGWAGSSGASLFLLGGVERFEPTDETGTCCTSKTATNRLSVPGHGLARKGLAGTVTLSRQGKRWLFAAEGDGESTSGCSAGSTRPKPEHRQSGSTRPCTTTWSRTSGRNSLSLPDETLEARPLVALHIPGRILFMSFAKTVWQLDLKTLEYSQLTPMPEEAFVDRFAWLDGRIIGAGGENKIESPRRRSEWTFIGEFGPE